MKSPFKDETLADIVQYCGSQEELMSTFKLLQKAMLEKALEGELGYHLGYDKSERSDGSNSRYGYGSKKIITNTGEFEIATPRDRDASFEPRLIQKGQREFKGFEEKIISMYARGMSMRDIQAQLEEMYSIDVSAEFISNVTDKVIDEVVSWQNRALDKVYPILYLDCLVVKVKENNQIINKSLFLAIGVNMEGHKEVLGMWLAKNEGAKFWLSVITEIRNRGVEEIYIACVDGLKGFPDAINSVFPKTIVQLCIVHMVRNSLNYVPWKDRKLVAIDLKAIYTASNDKSAELALQHFKDKWDTKYPTIADMWQRNWQGIIPFLSFPNDIRKAIYTTNTIESINRQIRKIIKSKGSFPNDEAVFKLVFLALQNAEKKWTMPIRDWKLALNQFAILFNSLYTL
ncbi:MAG: IS256 family transposase [Alphaproteobacteria bacterium 33-17]|nr:MAG: IS256 family transposase [Alphaproteobacteria bacterium 33-17]